jgi:hypothetical protein
MQDRKGTQTQMDGAHQQQEQDRLVAKGARDRLRSGQSLVAAGAAESWEEQPDSVYERTQMKRHP